MSILTFIRTMIGTDSRVNNMNNAQTNIKRIWVKAFSRIVQLSPLNHIIFDQGRFALKNVEK